MLIITNLETYKCVNSKCVRSKVLLEKEIIIPWNLEGKYKTNPSPPPDFIFM